jgi:hypothetical protein
MSFSKISFAIASVVVLAAGAPAFAGNDSGTTQTAVQTNDVSGRGNVTTNSGTQTSTTIQLRGNNSAGTKQTLDQMNTVTGRNNRTSNAVTQTAVTGQLRGR